MLYGALYVIMECYATRHQFINSSIESGIFPEQWKEAIVVLLLKKGDCKDLKNYKPVSCPPVESKE